jgi:hypothetical protein
VTGRRKVCATPEPWTRRRTAPLLLTTHARSFWFAAVEVAALALLRRNFMAEYYNDWSPREVCDVCVTCVM